MTETVSKIQEARQNDIQMENWYQDQLNRINGLIHNAHDREKAAFTVTAKQENVTKELDDQ